MGRGLKLVLLAVIVVAVIVSVVLYFTLKSDKPRVQTQCGEIEGDHDRATGVYSYKGIPYAVPPIGHLRWQPPLTPSKENGTCFDGVFKAHEFGSMCPQSNPTGDEGVVGSEDCLFLDIYTPTKDPSANLPVFIFLHGGSLTSGFSHADGYAPNNDITKELNVVMVSIQYRLGALGFLVIDALKDRTGNYGLLDVIESLKWVQKNIANFGGDPNKVTVSGQSSGGTLTKALMLSPLAKGLFHRNWISSASPVTDGTYAEAARRNQFYLNRTGCLSTSCTTDQCHADCLYNASPESLVIVQAMEPAPTPEALPVPGEIAIPLLVVDGHVIPYATFDAWNGNRKAELPDVPVIIGTTAQETDFLPPMGYDIYQWDQATYENYVRSNLQPFGGRIANQALSLYPYTIDAEYSYTTLSSDIVVNCGTGEVATAMVNTLTQPVYLYVVTAWPSSPMYAWGIPFPAKYAMHGLDTFAFFRHWSVYFSEPPTEQDDKFADLFVGNMKKFIEEGRPSAEWGTYPGVTALLNDTLQTSRVKYHDEECRFWMGNDFFQYGWMN